jgi:GMP synthase-like glutamine amidotransferase
MRPQDKEMKMRVAIIENTAVTHHGQVGVALHEAAARIDLWKPWRDEALPDLGAYDALVVFGGEQNARADATHPYLPKLARLMKQSADMGIATLGICLGSQVFARGLGADNHIGTAGEYGWCDVALTDAARADPVLSHLPERFAIMQWHSDTFTLPEGTTHLAHSPKAAAQCFRYGRAGYAMQFHFEANRAVAADWAREFGEAFEANRPGWVGDFATHAARDGAAADAHGLAIARAWVGLI